MDIKGLLNLNKHGVEGQKPSMVRPNDASIPKPPKHAAAFVVDRTLDVPGDPKKAGSLKLELGVVNATPGSMAALTDHLERAMEAWNRKQREGGEHNG